MSDGIAQEPAGGFGRRLLRTGMAWRRQLDAELREYGLTDASWRPVLLLGTLTDPSRDPDVRQSDIARLLVMDAPSLARLLEGLEADGMIRRREDPRDRRGKLVGLTPAGQDLFHRVFRISAGLSDRLLGTIPPEDLAACDRVLARIEATLAAERDPDAAGRDAP